jgi:hypothetical protein
LDELQEFLKGYGTVQNIVMRTRKTEEGKRIYKGSSFITFSDVETAQKFASLSDLKFKEIALINKMQDNYVADKKEKRKDEKELKRKMKTELIKEQKKAFDQPHFVAGSVLKVIGFKGDETVDELKVFFQQFGGVAYVKQEKDGDENSIVIQIISIFILEYIVI